MFNNNTYPIRIYNAYYNDNIKIYINITDKCNYQCYYCYNLNKNYNRQDKEINVNDVIFFLKRFSQSNPNKKIQITLIGGEPTRHTNFLNLCKEISQIENTSIESFTNFSAEDWVYSQAYEYRVRFLISFHYLNQSRTKYFLDKLQRLNKNDIMFSCINVMLEPHHFSQCLAVYDYLFNIYKNDIRCNLIDDLDKSTRKHLIYRNYSANEIDEYNKRCNNDKNDATNQLFFNDGTSKFLTNYEIKNNNDLNFRMWQCNAGKDYIYIDNDGSIYPCANMRMKKIGEIKYPYGVKFSKNICMSNICCEYGLPKLNIFKKK